MKRLIAASIILAVFLSLIAAWELFSRSFAEVRFILPAPSAIAGVLFDHADRFLVHSYATFLEMAAGIALASAAAFPAAWLMVRFGPLRAIFQPVFIALQCIPIFALAPIMVLLFGWTFAAIAVPAALMVFFPLVMSVFQGLKSTPKGMHELFILHRATPMQLFLKLQLPWALPQIFTGFRVAVSLAGIAAVAGEWAGAQRGLGVLMLESRRGADSEMMFGALVCVTLLSLCMYTVVVLFERLALRKRNAGDGLLKRIVALLFFAGCLVSCGKTEDKGETLLLLDWLPNPNHTALYAGIEDGLFVKHGIHLKVMKAADTGDGIPYVIGGQADLCVTYMPHAIVAERKGAGIVPVGKLIDGPLNAIIYRTNEGIGQVEDLRSKRIGYCVDGFDKAFLLAMFENRKVVPAEWKNVSFDLVNALGLGHVDALFGAYWTIESENLRSRGIDTAYFPLSAFGVPDYDELIIVARAGSDYASDAFVKRFKTAMQESIAAALKDPVGAFEKYVRVNPDKSRKTLEWEQAAWMRTLPVMARSQEIDRAQWDSFVAWMAQEGLLEGN